MKSWMLYLALLSTIVIILGSVIPLTNVSGGEEAGNVAHIISFTIISFLWARSLKSKVRYIALMTALIPLTEILNLPLHYRNPSTGDLIANILGVIIGFLISQLR
jgi:glycopeptide antibiotics resistance protein